MGAHRAAAELPAGSREAAAPAVMNASDALTLLGGSSRIRAGVGDLIEEPIRVRLQEDELVCGQRDAAPCPNHLETRGGRDPVEPVLQRRSALKPVQTSPGPATGLPASRRQRHARSRAADSSACTGRPGAQPSARQRHHGHRRAPLPAGPARWPAMLSCSRDRDYRPLPTNR